MQRIIYLLLLIVPVCGWAQEDSTKPAVPKKKNVFTASVNYQSRLHYFGRVDSLESSGFFPVVEYQLKSGIYANSSFIFLQNKGPVTGYTGAILEAGYRFPETKHFAGNVSVNKFLYKDNSELVQSALQWQTGTNLTWKNKFVNVTGGASLRFSDETDLVTSGVLDHLFIIKIPHRDSTLPLAIAFNPTFTVNAGTRKFSESYANRKTVLGLPVGQEEVITKQANAFRLLDYEFSMPVVLVISKLFIALTPTYVLPENLVTVNSNPGLSEKGKDLFYVTATVGVRL
jgi:hypothetical protein